MNKRYCIFRHIIEYEPETIFIDSFDKSEQADTEVMRVLDDLMKDRKIGYVVVLDTEEKRITNIQMTNYEAIKE